MALLIDIDDPRADDVRALIETHLAFARKVTPPEDVHALDADGILDPAITVFSARLDDEVIAVGALRRLDAGHVELKSMHTAAPVRGKGIGRAMLEHLLAIAADSGFRRVSLETGTMEAFAPARSLYQAAGFVPCEPFGDYRQKPGSVCMTIELAP